MARDFELSIVAPDRSVVEDRATSVVAPGLDGYFGVLAGHEPLIAGLKTGLLEYVDNSGRRHNIAIGSGFAEISGSRVTILADDARRAEEIDIAEAERRLDEARRTLRGEATSMSQEQATYEVEKAINQLKAARAR
jgi:F-type H+-transporting ATPase subunit epsilon